MTVFSFTLFLILSVNFLDGKKNPTDLLSDKFEKLATREKIYNYFSKRGIIYLNSTENKMNDKCITKLLQETINQFGNTYIFLNDGDLHENLLRNLQINFVHSLFSNPNLLKFSMSISFNHLLIFYNISVKEVLQRMKPLQNTKFFVMAKNYDDVMSKFEEFWKFRMTHVVVSFAVKGIAYYYTYFPYHSTHCGVVGTPFKVSKCNISSGVYIFKQELFPQKSIDLHHCPINITFAENVPSSYYIKSKKLAGWEIELIKEIIERMNGIPNYTMLKPKTRIYKTSKGYSALVENSEVGGGMAISLKGLMETDFCLYGQSLCVIWVVPRKFVTPHSMSFIWKVFPVDVWLLLLLSMIAMTSAFKIFLKSTAANIMFKLLPYILGTTTPTKKNCKLLGAIWLWFCITMNAIYQSGYQSTLLVPSKPEQLSTTSDVLKSQLKITGFPDIISDVLPYFIRTYNVSGRRLRLTKRTISYDKLLYRMIVRKDIAYLGFKETFLHHIDGTELFNKLYISQSCRIRYMLAFILKKNSYLTDNFVRFVERLNENGFVVFLMRKYLSQESRLNIPKKLTLVLTSQKGNNSLKLPSFDKNKMLVVLMLHSAGILLAFVVFLLELMSKWNWTKIKIITLQEIESAWNFE